MKRAQPRIPDVFCDVLRVRYGQHEEWWPAGESNTGKTRLGPPLILSWGPGTFFHETDSFPTDPPPAMIHLRILPARLTSDR